MSHSERCLSANRFGDFDCICEPDPRYRAGYEDGLRRAQELAKESIVLMFGSTDGSATAKLDFEEFCGAIDDELAKERP